MKLQLFHICSSLSGLVLLSLVLLVLSPSGSSLPHQSAAYLHALEDPDWEAALLQLQALIGGAPGGALIGELGPEELLARLQGVESQVGWAPAPSGGVLRDLREDLGRRPLGPFPQHPMETVHYQQGGGVEGEGSEKRNEALMSIAGGLQAFNRQKGGFGFRFGRK
uniref:Pyroglutamylated RFamide peptide n=1 Tax=Astyanax mexicanus TaxID=7994 RepID=A0A3B1JDZ4_ASTMX